MMVVVLFVLLGMDDIVVVVEQYFSLIALEYSRMNLFRDNPHVRLPMLVDVPLNLLEHLDR